MVSFSCEVCNDTIIKKKLDQHQQRCYGAYFTCIDCSTTFSGNDHRAHTSCISEAEKYEKALYKGPLKQRKTNGKVNTKETSQDKAQKSPVEDKTAPISKQVDVKTAVSESEAKPLDKTSSILAKHIANDKKSLYKVLKKASKKEKLELEAILKRLDVQMKDGKIFITEKR